MRDVLLSIDLLARNWRAVVLRGVLSLLFGLLALSAPGLSLLVLTFTFGACAIADGALALASALRHEPGDSRRWLYWVEGAFGLGAGAISLFWPGITLWILLYASAVRALAVGGLEVVAAIRLRKVIVGEWLLATCGVASVLFGVLLLGWPGAALVTVALLIGVYALLLGVAFIALGLRMRVWRNAARASLPAALEAESVGRAAHG